jgi:hypothetical protein
MSINTLPSNWSSLTETEKDIMTFETQIERFVTIQKRRPLNKREVEHMESLKTKLSDYISKWGTK